MSTQYDEALTDLRGNALATWAPKNLQGMSEIYAAGRIHDGYAKIHATAKFKFGRNDSFFCVGSCFAREVEDAIERAGLSPRTKIDFLPTLEARGDLFERVEGVSGRPTAFLNRYNLGSMADHIENVADLKHQEGDLLYAAGNGKFHDYSLTRFLKPLSLEACLERRMVVNDLYRSALQKSTVFVFTFGLCEAFLDLDSGKYLNVAPDPRVAKGHNINFKFLSLEENVAMGRRIVDVVKKINPQAIILLTVSPVPLDATFTKHDIVVANSLAKAILVAAAHEVASDENAVHYFPSFEIVMNTRPDLAWKWDKKHVADGMVEHIMGSFLEDHLSV